MPIDIGAERGERWVCRRKQRGKIFWRSFRRPESTNAFFSYKSRCTTVSLTQKHDVSALFASPVGLHGLGLCCQSRRKRDTIPLA